MINESLMVWNINPLCNLPNYWWVWFLAGAVSMFILLFVIRYILFVDDFI